ncbi:MAG: T9SS type A sorting domain-containing protein [Flavobacteriales bacterium]|nr:T9SS type A sorting domain-containing protein [Flavobacteriales bacterium]
MFHACKTQRGGGTGGVYTLPVVFHVLYNDANQNVPDSVIYSQLEVLNEDYRRLNADAVNTRDIFLPVAADCEIQFALATVDPQGNPTTGIEHITTDRTEFTLEIFSTVNTLDEVKHASTGGADAWDTEHYINVWICNITTDFPGAQIFGMSYPPSGLDNWPANSSSPTTDDDGIVVHYTTVGRNNPVSEDDGTDLNDLGRTLTHEMGHYLGLRHTWGDEFFGDLCSEDDGIDDTPLCGSGDQFECDLTANTCDDGTLDDQPDMIENYMDYNQDECYNMFTEGQKILMRYALEELRSGLLQSFGISTMKKTEQVLWPNPVADVLQIHPDWKGSDFRIHHTSGQLVQSGTLNKTEISVDDLSSGLYLIYFSKGEMTYSTRFMVHD